MTPRVDFGLSSIGESTDIQHGMSFVVKWPNPAIGKKQDLWLGIHVPDSIAPQSLLSKRKKNSTSDTPAAKRAYMFYLPGRNTYAWIDRKSLFPLSEYPPEDFKEGGHEHHSLYKRIYELIDEQGELQYWTQMAKRERAAKGVFGKEPSLVLPPGDGDEDDYDMDDGSEPEHEPGRKRRMVDPKILFGKKSKVESLPENGEEIVMVFIGKGLLQKIYHLSRNNLGKSSFLKRLIQGNPPYLFHPTLFEMNADDFEPVYAYLSSSDPDCGFVVPIDESLEDALLDDDHILGDALGIGRSYWLKNVNTIGDIQQLLPQLEKEYNRAISLGLEEMAHSAIVKVQVAWNVYCGVAQLPLFLDFFEKTMPSTDLILAYQSVFVGSPSQAPPFATPSASSLSATRQQWATDFLAETMMLIVAIEPQRFINFMQAYPYLQTAVLGSRQHFSKKYSECLARLETEFMKREPFKEGNFIHHRQGGQSELGGSPDTNCQNGQGGESELGGSLDTECGNGQGGLGGSPDTDGKNDQGPE